MSNLNAGLRRNSVGAQQGLLYNTRGRRQKAEKIRAALGITIPTTEAMSLLDIGCASGIITRALAPHFAYAVGMDLNESGLRLARSDPQQEATCASLLRATTSALPFPDCFFDVAICAQVYEHVADQAALADEVFRVLKPGGWMFFSGPNRAWPIEDHYKLIGLGWIPRNWASRYLRLAGRGQVFEENLLTSAQLRRLFGRFDHIDVTPMMIKNPVAFHIQSSWATALFAKLPETIVRGLSWIYPNPNWLLRKPPQSRATMGQPVGAARESDSEAGVR